MVRRELIGGGPTERQVFEPLFYQLGNVRNGAYHDIARLASTI